MLSKPRTSKDTPSPVLQVLDQAFHPHGTCELQESTSQYIINYAADFERGGMFQQLCPVYGNKLIRLLNSSPSGTSSLYEVEPYCKSTAFMYGAMEVRDVCAFSKPFLVA